MIFFRLNSWISSSQLVLLFKITVISSLVRLSLLKFGTDLYIHSTRTVDIVVCIGRQHIPDLHLGIRRLVQEIFGYTTGFMAQFRYLAVLKQRFIMITHSIT